jgi:large subunit ribosomal protein L19
MDDIIRSVESPQIRDDYPDFKPGDTVKVHFQVVEGDKTRVQIFQGVVISRRGGGVSETFIVRKISSGISVERIFPLNSPLIEKIEVTRAGKVRRAKLFYLRDKKGKAARIKEKKTFGARN